LEAGDFSETLVFIRHTTRRAAIIGLVWD